MQVEAFDSSKSLNKVQAGAPLEPLKYTSDSAQVCVCVCVCTYIYYVLLLCSGVCVCVYVHIYITYYYWCPPSSLSSTLLTLLRCVCVCVCVYVHICEPIAFFFISRERPCKGSPFVTSPM